MQYSDVIYIILELISVLLLFLLAGYASKALNSKWRLCYLLPAIVTMFVTAFMGVEQSLFLAYLGTVLVMAGFFKEKEQLRKGTALLAGVLLLVSIPICLFNPAYRAADYTKDFKETFATLKEHYILSEHKEIDWDGLYQKYLPMMEEADRSHNEVEAVIVWKKFSHAFHDGHVSFSANEEVEEKVSDRVFGNDYGLSLMTLDNQKTVAVNVDKDSEAYRAGIRNGTEVTAWDGRTIEEGKQGLTYELTGFANVENEAFYDTLLVAGVGREQVEVSFLDERGTQQTVTLSRRGAYTDRLKQTLSIINQSVEGDNLSWSEPDNNTVCLKLREMMYDSSSYQNGDHSKMKEELRKKLEEYKAAGKNKLILDLRSNGGGSPQFILALAELLAPKGEHTFIYDGVWDEKAGNYAIDKASGRYKTGKCFTYTGEDLLEGGRIIVLVNGETISAGDHLVKLLSEYDNVKIAGFTPSNGSAQGVRGISLGYGQLTFSAVPCLNEDGSIFIDSDASRVSDMPLDLKIPFDENAVKALFDEGKDYIMEYVV